MAGGGEHPRQRAAHVKDGGWGAWWAQSVEHMTLDLEVMSSSPTLGIEIVFFFLRLFIYLFMRVTHREAET